MRRRCATGSARRHAVRWPVRQQRPSRRSRWSSLDCTAGMITSRLAFTDMELNPRAIENQTISKSGIYKKFDKAKRLLAEEARGKQLAVRLVGERLMSKSILCLPSNYCLLFCWTTPSNTPPPIKKFKYCLKNLTGKPAFQSSLRGHF